MEYGANKTLLKQHTSSKNEKKNTKQTTQKTPQKNPNKTTTPKPIEEDHNIIGILSQNYVDLD